MALALGPAQRLGFWSGSAAGWCLTAPKGSGSAAGWCLTAPRVRLSGNKISLHGKIILDNPASIDYITGMENIQERSERKLGTTACKLCGRRHDLVILENPNGQTEIRVKPTLQCTWSGENHHQSIAQLYLRL